MMYKTNRLFFFKHESEEVNKSYFVVSIQNIFLR